MVVRRMDALHTAYIALGGNLGDVLVTFCRAIDELNQAGVAVTEVAPAYRTIAEVKKPCTSSTAAEDYFDYWNTVCRVTTTCSPWELIEIMMCVEKKCGRVRTQKWGARTLDLDLLLFDDMHLQSARLTLPHSRMGERAFVLRPLCDIAGHLMIPLVGKTAAELLAELPDANAGIIEVRRRWMMKVYE